jgi:hypothetical protein
VTFTINATDANGCTGSTTRSVTVGCPTFNVTNGVLMLSPTGTAYTQQTGFSVSSNAGLNATGYTWSLVSPPAGVTIGSTDGKLTIANSVAANAYNLTVRATANAPYANCFTDRAVSYRVCPLFTWTPAFLPAATVGVSYDSVLGTQVTATGSAAIVSYTLSGAPAWMSITNAGQLQGTPIMSAAPVSFTITAVDANGCSSSITRSVSVACPAFTITNGAAMMHTTGASYTQATGFAASSNAALNTAGYTWSLNSPPVGFSMGVTDGKLTVAGSVTPGLYNLSVQSLANAPYSSCAESRTVGYRVCPVFTWTPATIPDATVGQSYASLGGTVIAATGSAAIVSYTLSGAPSWLEITNAGQLQGTPVASAASSTFTITATDANGCSASITRSITVNCPAITITNGVAMQSVAGTAYTQATGFSASSNPGLNAAGFGWNLVTPPAGFTMGSTDGRLTIASSVVAGLYSLNVRATANSPFTACASVMPRSAAPRSLRRAAGPSSTTRSPVHRPG